MLKSRHLLVLARWVLIFGSISLVSGGIRLFRRALEAGLPTWHLAWILPVAIIVGAGKAQFVMRKRMRRNIARLRAAQGKMWAWQIYPPQLLAFIASMVLMMIVLKRVFAESAAGLGALGGLDAAVAVALMVASLEYGRSGAPAGESAAEAASGSAPETS